MFKLLTEEAQEKMANEYTRRRTVVMLAAFATLLVISAVGLFPSYIILRIRQGEVFEQMAVVAYPESTEDATGLKVHFSETNRRLRALSPKLDTDQPSVSVGQILEQKIAGIRITGISWTKTDDKVAISVTGISRDRQTLLTFEDRINTSQHFSDVTLPISDFARNKDIDFQIKFTP